MMKEKTLLDKFCVLLDRNIRLLANILARNHFFLKNYVTSEGVVSHKVLYQQQLSNARYQVSF